MPAKGWLAASGRDYLGSLPGKELQSYHQRGDRRRTAWAETGTGASRGDTARDVGKKNTVRALRGPRSARRGMKDKSVGKRGRKGTSARNAGRSAEGIADVPEFGGEAARGPEQPYGSGPGLCGLPRIHLLGTSVNKG